MSLNLNTDDQQLIAAAQQDPAAFRALYDKYVDKIFQFIYFRMNHDRSLAYDLTSEVFTRALQYINNFEWQGYSYSSYLYKIARSICSSASQTNHLAAAADIEQISDSTMDLTQKIDLKLVWEKITEFSPEIQELFELHYLEGLSYEEIGKIIQKKPSSLRTTMTRALAKLRQQFNPS